MVEKPEVGGVYWHITPFDEQGDPWGYQSPTFGKVSRVEQAARCVTIHAFDARTGKIDEDTNATAHVYREGLYATEAEALTAYIKAMENHIEEIEGAMETATDRLRAMGQLELLWAVPPAPLHAPGTSPVSPGSAGE